jgi:hypothetical protein
MLIGTDAGKIVPPDKVTVSAKRVDDAIETFRKAREIAPYDLCRGEAMLRPYTSHNMWVNDRKFFRNSEVFLFSSTSARYTHQSQ